MSELRLRDSDGCGDAAAYLLGSLERDEADVFKQHREACVVCRDEINAYEEVLWVLPMAVPQFRAPKRLRRSVIRAVRQERQLGRSPGWQGAGRRALGAHPRLAWSSLLASATIAAATVAIVLFSSGGPAKQEIEANVLSGPGQAQVLLSGGQEELILHGVRPSAPRHVYEVWVQRGQNSPTPVDVLFKVAPSGDAQIGLPRDLHGASRLLVTQERDGGSPAPTSSPVIVAELT
jgi:anti-sigma-K factor RskA